MDGKTYVKLLVRFENTSTLILPLVILSFRSKKSNPSSPPACIVNLIFPVSSMLLRKSNNKEREAEPCIQAANKSSQNLFHVVGQTQQSPSN